VSRFAEDGPAFKVVRATWRFSNEHQGRPARAFAEDDVPAVPGERAQRTFSYIFADFYQGLAQPVEHVIRE
jgi:hypothetical protein